MREHDRWLGEASIERRLDFVEQRELELEREQHLALALGDFAKAKECERQRRAYLDRHLELLELRIAKRAEAREQPAPSTEGAVDRSEGDVDRSGLDK